MVVRVIEASHVALLLQLWLVLVGVVNHGLRSLCLAAIHQSRTRLPSSILNPASHHGQQTSRLIPLTIAAVHSMLRLWVQVTEMNATVAKKFNPCFPGQ